MLAKADQRLGDLSNLTDLRSDLVVAAYALTELPDAPRGDSRRAALGRAQRRFWSSSNRDGRAIMRA